MPCCGARPGPASSPTSPVVLGDSGGDVYHVRATVNVSGFRPGDKGWITGLNAPALIASTSFVLLESP